MGATRIHGELLKLGFEISEVTVSRYLPRGPVEPDKVRVRWVIGFGATGLTFFDDDVTDLFSPHAAGKSVMFLVALGYSERAALGLKR